MSYFNKYHKYKKKYLQLQRNFSGGANDIKTILTINDPYTKGVISGDVDDWFSLLFLAQSYGEKLHILIVDAKDRCGKPHFDYMVKFIMSMYNCIFHFDNNLDVANIYGERFDICLISAPLPQNVHDLLRDYPYMECTYYLQGGIVGYNSLFTFPKDDTKFKWANKVIINLDTEHTNQSFKISTVDHYYNINPMCINWNTYQLKKVFSVLYAPFSYGFWFDKTTGNIWSGSGNTKNTLDIIISSIENFDIIKERTKINPIIQTAYYSYVDDVCRLRNNSTMPNHSQSQEIIDQQIRLLKQEYDNVIIVAQYIFGDNAEHFLIRPDGKIKQIGDLNNFNIPRGLLNNTPKLFDFNMSATIINMDKLGLNYKDQSLIIETIPSLQQSNLDSFNIMLHTLQKDFDIYQELNNPVILFL